MDFIRRTLGGLFAILGAYYCILSLLTLVRLPSVTSSWIQQSGDPDFRYDYGTFMLWIAVGAGIVGVFGYRTAVKGTMAALGRRESWWTLAIAAPLLHWFWFLYRTVSSGVLERGAQQIAMRRNGIEFGLICLAYAAMWILMRSKDSAPGAKPTSARLQLKDIPTRP